jgi:hypothetical protein
MSKAVKIGRPTQRPKIDESQLVNNPFTESLIIPVKIFKTTDEFIRASEKDGLITKITKIGEERVFEDGAFTKIYNRSAFRINIFSMSEKARSLFLWLIYEINPSVDWLWINKDRYMFESTVSVNTYKAAITELVFHKIITPTIYQDTYWINPTYLFNGNRIAKYPTRLKER